MDEIRTRPAKVGVASVPNVTVKLIETTDTDVYVAEHISLQLVIDYINGWIENARGQRSQSGSTEFVFHDSRSTLTVQLVSPSRQQRKAFVSHVLRHTPRQYG